MQQRPTSVTVFGILNIIFGAMALLCTPVSLMMTFMMPAQGNPMLQAMRDNQLFRVWSIVGGGLGIIGGGVLLAAGIGLLKLKPWARVTSVGYGIYAIVGGVIGQVITMMVLLPAFRKMTESGGPEAAGAIGGMVGGVFGGCFGLIFPILLIIFMTRPKVKAAFLPQA